MTTVFQGNYVRPRSMVHHGFVFVQGFVIHPDLVGELEARKRVIRLLYPGAQVRKWGDKYLVLLATQARTWADTTLGTPLVPTRVGDTFVPSAAPLTESEGNTLLAILDNRVQGYVVVSQGGKALPLEVQTLPQVDPAMWLDLTKARLIRVESLGMEPIPVAALGEPKTNLAEIIGPVPGTARAKTGFIARALREKERKSFLNEANNNPTNEDSGGHFTQDNSLAIGFLILVVGMVTLVDIFFLKPIHDGSVFSNLKFWPFVVLGLIVFCLLVSLAVSVLWMVLRLAVAGVREILGRLWKWIFKIRPVEDTLAANGKDSISQSPDSVRVISLFKWLMVFLYLNLLFLILRNKLPSVDWIPLGVIFLVVTLVMLLVYGIRYVVSRRQALHFALSTDTTKRTRAGMENASSGVWSRFFLEGWNSIRHWFKKSAKTDPLDSRPISRELDQETKKRANSHPFLGVKNAWRAFLKWLGNKNQNMSVQNVSNSSLLEQQTRRFLAKLYSFTGLDWWIHRQRVRYMRQMLDFFERGNLQEALRHALPLTDKPADPNAPPAFSLDIFRPRDIVKLFPNKAKDESQNVLSAELFNRLKEIYRQAFGELDKAGKTEEAVFLLVDLLDSPEEAVAYLEGLGLKAFGGRWGVDSPGVVVRQLLQRKILLTQAAELAESRALNPPLVVRQWCVAGDFDRAVAIARLTNSFSAAVALMENKNHPGAEKLCQLWANSLAAGGDWAGAVDVAWPRVLTEGFPVCAHPNSGSFPHLPFWMDKAVAAGGPGAGHVLALQAGIVSTEDYPALRERVQNLILNSTTAYQERLAFGQTLIAQACQSRIARLFARQIIKALIQDSFYRPMPKWYSMTQKQLLTLAGDTLMRHGASLYVKPIREPLEYRKEPFNFCFSSTDLGTYPVFDAVWLAGERVLVALGEAGMRLMDGTGKILASFGEPAHHLVPSDNNLGVIAVADRGKTKRLSRLDVSSKVARYWCDAPIRCHAQKFDGQTWFVALEDELVALDTQADDLRFLWRAHGKDFEMPDGFGAGFSRLLREGAVLWGLRGEPGKETSWQWSYPDLVLRHRNLPLRGETNEKAMADQGVGAVREVRLNYTTDNTWPIICTVTHSPMADPSSDKDRSISLLASYPTSQTTYYHAFFTSRVSDLALEQAEVYGFWNAFVLRELTGENTRLVCLVHYSGNLVQVIRLENSRGTRCRFSLEELTITDQMGRFISVQLADGAITILRVV